MMTQELPPTSRARLYRKILGVVWVLSISGITLALANSASALMDVGFNPVRLDGKQALFNACLLLGEALTCWMAYRGNRRNLRPPEWGMLTVVALVWAAILLNRLA